LAYAVARTFRAHPAALRLVRDFVRAEANAAGFDAEADDLVLAASEAAGNAVRHSNTDRIMVKWNLEGDEVDLQVHDRGVFKRRVVLPLTEGGRGIFLMMALVDEVSIEEGSRERPGTTVRLRKTCRPAEGPRHGRHRLTRPAIA
jgi:anti-sigma regulatory factor (Ser/Thr protein kinase)